MDAPSLPPSSPSCATPLFPISPERINRRGTPQTPSYLSSRLKEDQFFSSNLRSSDVQNKVLQFNQLADNGSPKRKEQQDAALRRAILGREEAEAKLKILEDDDRSLQQSVEEGRAREHKMAQRIEEMMEEMQQEKEGSTRARAVYEKEVRRARKEAFKSSSALVKLQEELKTARNRYTLMREEAEAYKRKMETIEQDLFSTQYKLVAIEEEADKLRQLLQTAEQERDALRMSLKEEEVARIAAEGRIPLPRSEEDDEFASPQKRQTRRSLASPSTHADVPFEIPNADQFTSKIRSLERELSFEQHIRHEAQETVNFMKLECQLLSCSCRRAERAGQTYVHDSQLESIWTPPTQQPNSITPQAKTQERGSTPEDSVIIRHDAKVDDPLMLSPMSEATQPSPSEPPSTRRSGSTIKGPENIVLTFDSSMLSPTLAGPSLPSTLAPAAMSESPSLLSLPGRPSDECHMIAAVSLPTTPCLQAIPMPSQARTAPRETTSHPHDPATESYYAQQAAEVPSGTHGLRLVTNTTTIKIPLADPDSAPRAGKTADSGPPKFPFSPGATKTREEALQSIQRWREGRSRARSVTTGSAAIGRKRSGTGQSPARRDISAPERRAA